MSDPGTQPQDRTLNAGLRTGPAERTEPIALAGSTGRDASTMAVVGQDAASQRPRGRSTSGPAQVGAGRTAGVPTGRVRTKGGAPRPSRKARLRVAKLDPWSVMKTSLMFSIAAAIMLFVAVALLWGVVEASGMLDKVQEMVDALLGNADGTGSVQVSSFIDRWRVLGFTAIVCGINVILLTALATLGAFLYNLSSSVLGGLDVTLAED